MSRGHALADIKDYSLAKFKGFLEAINQLEKEEVKLRAIAARVSQADAKDFEKFMKE